MSDLEIKNVDKKNLKTIVVGKVPLELTKTLEMYYDLNNQGTSTNEIGHALVNITHRFLNPFFHKYGLEIKDKEIHFYNQPDEKMPHAFMEFKSREILLRRENNILTAEVLDGYKIHGDLKFGEDNVEIGTYLERDGLRVIEILEKLARIENKKGDGIKKPLALKKEREMHIAGIQWVNPALERIEQAYEFIGKKRLEELSELYFNTGDVEENSAKKFLQQQYNNAMHWASLKDKF